MKTDYPLFKVYYGNKKKNIPTTSMFLGTFDGLMAATEAAWDDLGTVFGGFTWHEWGVYEAPLLKYDVNFVYEIEPRYDWSDWD